MTTDKERKRREAFNRKGSGKWNRDNNYEDTLTYTEAMEARGYVKGEDGEWR